MHLILPMTTYVFLLFALTLAMFFRRLRAIRSGEVSPKYFLAYTGSPPPERTLVLAQHYDNQFQVPMLFLIGCTAHLALGHWNTLTVALAWLFLLTRAAHTWYHVGNNYLPRRAMSFAAGWFEIVLLWAQLLYVNWPAVVG